MLFNPMPRNENKKEEEFENGAKKEKEKYSWDKMLVTIDGLLG
ncbi:hypothetical protein ACFLQ5_03670 [Bacteroidota bacterium]